MATPHAVKLLEAAKSGEKISPQDRRHVIAYLQMISEVSKEANGTQYVTAPMSNYELAQIFGVAERTIRVDKQIIRQQMAEEIKNEDIALILADVRLTFTRVMLNIEKSASKAALGTRTYLDHQIALAKLQVDYVKGMQDLGVYPKELGTLHVDKFEFTATVGLEAAGRPTNLFDKKREAPVIDAQLAEVKVLTDGENSENQSGTGTAAAEENHAAADNDKASNADVTASTQLPTVQAD